MSIESIMQRIKLIFGIGTVTRPSAKMLQLKLATGITNDRIKRPHNYGFMSHPLEESRAYTLFIGGDTSRGIAVCVEDERHEIELQPGEVAMLDDKGNLIHFTASGIDIKSPGLVNVECESAKVEASGDVDVDGAIINLNSGAGVVTGAHICAYTGVPHSDCSASVNAGK